MASDTIPTKYMETDVLVVGGGIAGCPAAWKAAKNGLNVIMAEKSNPARSGSASCGIDHYGGFYKRGMTPKDWRAELDKFSDNMAYGMPRWADPERVYRQYANQEWAVEQLEEMGVTMKWTDGDYRPMECHHEGPFLRVHWHNVKPEMAKAVLKAGVNVLKRTMVVDLLTNQGTVVGATAIDTRTGDFIVIKAKAVVMATAQFMRLYVPPNHKYGMTFYEACPASISGDGWAMVYRAGGELANMEQSMGEQGFREGKCMSWGNHGNEGIQAKEYLGEGVEVPRAPRGEEPTDIKYLSLHHLPDDFKKRVEVCFLDERMVAFQISQDRGFDFRNHWFELAPVAMPGRLHMQPGIWVDRDMKASLKGLYAAGDCVA
ncbi:FAD-dependent oxidoreductase, partial [Verrucomicrobia bacterium]|nr:FAD-dependent oxidoreductase [Verrucomicrobiota bacterium]